MTGDSARTTESRFASGHDLQQKEEQDCIWVEDGVMLCEAVSSKWLMNGDVRKIGDGASLVRLMHHRYHHILAWGVRMTGDEASLVRLMHHRYCHISTQEVRRTGDGVSLVRLMQHRYGYSRSLVLVG